MTSSPVCVGGGQGEVVGVRFGRSGRGSDLGASRGGERGAFLPASLVVMATRLSGFGVGALGVTAAALEVGVAMPVGGARSLGVAWLPLSCGRHGGQCSMIGGGGPASVSWLSVLHVGGKGGMPG